MKTSRYFRDIGPIKRSFDLIWKLEPDGSWYVKYPTSGWLPRNGPWCLKNLKRIYKKANNVDHMFIEISEEDYFLELI